MFTEITPLFQLSELGLPEPIMTNLEAHFVSELMLMEQMNTLGRIAGLDERSRRSLARAIHDLSLRKKAEMRKLNDSGMQRLYSAMTAQVQNISMGRDFFRLTEEKVQIMRAVLQDESELYRPEVALPCLRFRYGLDGEEPHTVEECARSERVPLAMNWEVEQVISRNLRVLAAHIVPNYAMRTIGDPAQIHLNYLQLSTRTRNALLRTKLYEMVADLTQYPLEQFRRRTPGIGDKSIEEIRHQLRLCGLGFAGEDDAGSGDGGYAAPSVDSCDNGRVALGAGSGASHAALADVDSPVS